MRGNMYWKREEERLCRTCKGGRETWEHVWEDCGRWGAEGSWQEMMGMVLGEEEEGEEWLRELEKFKEGRWEDGKGEGVGMNEGMKGVEEGRVGGEWERGREEGRME
ncbi:hypothetical protein RF55_15621 [Lasius niger]|uniref:Uncharacterized protein n=1 Tax=Lasius niger TaxID=67767 RepID=A0A0J7K601_LASNI|nr:hypothetical protein RF55_15621 [Lasius niger]